jgi:hypothetical protein
MCTSKTGTAIAVCLIIALVVASSLDFRPCSADQLCLASVIFSDDRNKTKDDSNKTGRSDESFMKKEGDGEDSSEEKLRQQQSGDRLLPKGATIIVGERPLTGASSLPQQRGQRIFLPVAPIAHALGDLITVNPLTRSVEVRRQTGITADFSAQTNQVRENGLVILVVSDTADITFPPNPEELMLPIEIVSPLLDVSIFIDEAARAVRVTRGQAPTSSARDGSSHGSFELYQTDYSYNLNLYSSSFNQYAQLHSSGRIGNGRFTLISNLDGGARQTPLNLRNGSFTLDMPNRQRFIGGDFGTGTDLEFMSSLVRGIFAQRPFGSIRVTAFAGRATSSPPLIANPSTEEPLPAHSGLIYDTNVFGSYLTLGKPPQNSSQAKLLSFSSGLIYFGGPTRRGEMVTSSFKYFSARNQFQGDWGFGSFAGINLEGKQVRGLANMLDISEVFNLRDNLTLQGHLTHIGSNFLSPQSGGFFSPMNLFIGGLSWRPKPWLTASFTATSRARLNVSGQGERTLTSAISITPRGIWPTILITHTHSNNIVAGTSNYTLINATKEFSRWRLFANFNRIRIANLASLQNPIQNQIGRQSIPPNISLTLGAMVKIKTSHTLQVSQTIGSGGALGGTLDWITNSFPTKRISIGAGFGYGISGSKFTPTERLLIMAQLPHQQAIQLTYIQTQTGPQLSVGLRGSLARSRKSEAVINAPLAEIKSFGAFYGKVYQDVNLNGKFDPGIDQPQANVQIRVDGNFYALTDHNGNFRVDNIKAGQHTIYIDLLSVRADLTLLDSAQQTAVLRPGRDQIVDFRLVRTGRIRGIVWLDANGNGRFDDGEQPLSDVRVLTSSGRDTLTDAQGEFVLGDLPPGEHIVLIDEKTLPENTKPSIGSLRVTVRAGSEARDVNFPITHKPAQINVRRFPPSGQ